MLHFFYKVTVKKIMIYICGLLMALADSVPGVSGGTIAYLLGYYEEFINSLNSFLTAKGDKSERKIT